MNVDELFNKAFAYSNSGDYKNALDYYNKVTDLEPRAYGAWMNKGIIFEMFNNIEEAIKCYDIVIGIKPNLLQASSNLGRLYFNMREYHKAKYWLKKMIDFGNNEAQTLMAYQICIEKSQEYNLVFISYRWRNKNFVTDNLLPFLKINHIEYFIDQAKIPQSEENGELPWQIEQGLAQSELVILVWSAFVSESYWVNTEICSSIGMLKTILLIAIDDTPIPIIFQTGIKNGKIKLYNWSIQDDHKKLVLDLAEHKNWSIEVNNINSDIQTNISLYKNLKFEWVKLNGGLIHDFYVGKYPVTQEQWEKVMGYNPSKYKGDKSRPVENVSWKETQEFNIKLSKYFNIEHKLLTDIEWEYACRAGSIGNWCFGDDEDELYAYAWLIDNSGIGTTPGIAIGYGHEEGRPSKRLEIETSPFYTNSVFSKQPNRWGIYHMHGNVWEWCQDNFFNEANKICRGGSFKCGGRSLRCASRDNHSSYEKFDDVGFRICKLF